MVSAPAAGGRGVHGCRGPGLGACPPPLSDGQSSFSGPWEMETRRPCGHLAGSPSEVADPCPGVQRPVSPVGVCTPPSGHSCLRPPPDDPPLLSDTGTLGRSESCDWHLATAKGGHSAGVQGWVAIDGHQGFCHLYLYQKPKSTFHSRAEPAWIFSGRRDCLRGPGMVQTEAGSSSWSAVCCSLRAGRRWGRSNSRAGGAGKRWLESPPRGQG